MNADFTDHLENWTQWDIVIKRKAETYLNEVTSDPQKIPAYLLRIEILRERIEGGPIFHAIFLQHMSRVFLHSNKKEEALNMQIEAHRIFLKNEHYINHASYLAQIISAHFFHKRKFSEAVSWAKISIEHTTESNESKKWLPEAYSLLAIGLSKENKDSSVLEPLFRKSISLWETRLNKEPDFLMPSYFILGLHLIKKGELEKAKEVFEEAFIYSLTLPKVFDEWRLLADKYYREYVN